MVYITRGLVDVLLELAADAEPSRLTTGLSVSESSTLEGADAGLLPAEAPVFTDFFLPDPGNAVNAVFGVTLSTPASETQGRFVSHPTGELLVTRRDDLAEVVFVAVPPWEPTPESFAAFDRAGKRLPLEIVDAEPPVESLE
ncbi:hypothetical protein [Natronosalvus caseinilyticus]|uniref:hypothetical protein n=1 Tax=Natronosalvus caseinilyticus TaxID=2953747 RepID=UPI0028B1A24D|nr:hypothetical protein [Natronosalvus caseinilyticus]